MESSQKLGGKVALVTGASRGIGRATALKLAELGADVAINCLTRKKEAEKVADQIRAMGRSADVFEADVSSWEKVRKMIADIRDTIGPVAILVNNASPPVVLQELEESVWDDFESYMRVEVRGTYNTTRAVLADMKENQYGKVINILSYYIFHNLPKKVAPYVTAKEALWGLTKASAGELASYGIRVNAVSPWVTDTEMAEEASPPRFKELIARSAPLGKITSPEDVADVVGFLASPESDHLTGINIPIGIV